MFTIEQITDFHARLGSAKTFLEYVLALKGLGVERCDSYLADGHSGYSGPPASARAARDDLLRDVQGLGAERDREVDCEHKQDDDDVLR